MTILASLPGKNWLGQVEIVIINVQDAKENVLNDLQVPTYIWTLFGCCFQSYVEPRASIFVGRLL